MSWVLPNQYAIQMLLLINIDQQIQEKNRRKHATKNVCREYRDSNVERYILQYIEMH